MQISQKKLFHFFLPFFDIASLSRSVQNKTADEIELPPEPQGKCSKALQVKTISPKIYVTVLSLIL